MQLAFYQNVLLLPKTAAATSLGSIESILNWMDKLLHMSYDLDLICKKYISNDFCDENSYRYDFKLHINFSSKVYSVYMVVKKNRII